MALSINIISAPQVLFIPVLHTCRRGLPLSKPPNQPLQANYLDIYFNQHQLQ